jgi:hypothetical protein
MISVWWSGLAGIEIDLKRDLVVLNGENGWTGVLTGPAVASIAVAATAMCQGVDALHVHPALEFIGQRDQHQRVPPRDANALAVRGAIVELSTRQPRR